jgi:type IV pilus assembly protein PilY1
MHAKLSWSFISENPVSSCISRLVLGLTLLGAPGLALAQTAAPANIHFLIDTSGSMQELPQVSNGNHAAFFDMTVNGCSNPRLDALQTSQGWNPNTVYPVADPGTGVGTDTGFPNLFQDSKFYGYLYWAASNNPSPQWNSREEACQAQVPDWSGTGAADYNQCLSCLFLKGYYKAPGAVARNSPPLQNPDFIFWGRFLNFNPPKYVSVRAALKQALNDVQNARVGYSYFINSQPNTVLAQSQKAACDEALASPSAFDPYRASYINAINNLVFNAGTPLARSLLNIGYHFTSDITVYRDSLGFGTAYSYPVSFANSPLSSQSRSVCWGCQHSAVVIVTDGEPSGDTLGATMANRLRTLNGGPLYCPDTEPCGKGTLATRDMGADPFSYADDNPDYYLDDVAKVLATYDLQQNTPPVVGDFDTSGPQRLTIHTVGYGINSNLLKNTAAVGGGLYYSAETPAALEQALQNILADIETRGASCTHVP